MPDSNGNRFQVVEWKPYAKNTLAAFVSFRLPSGMILNECTLHIKSASRWIGLPARPYEKQDGTRGWQPVIEIPDRNARDKFQRAALAAVDEYLATEGAK